MSLYKGTRKVAGLCVVDETPIGSIIPFAGTEVKGNYLYCDGRAVNRIVYKELFDVIGTTYGAGDGSTTFNLPDLRDRFLQGIGTRTLAVGTKLAEALPQHTHKHSHTHTKGSMRIWGSASYVTVDRGDGMPTDGAIGGWRNDYSGPNGYDGQRWTINFDTNYRDGKGWTGSTSDASITVTEGASHAIYKDTSYVQPLTMTVKYYIKANRNYLDINTDETLSPTSTNPIQNKAVYEALVNFGVAIPVGGVFESLGTEKPSYGTWEALPDRYEWNDEGDLSGNGYTPVPASVGIRFYIRNNMVIVKIINLLVSAFNNDTVYLDNDHAKYRPGVDVFTQTGDYSSATASGVFCIRATGKFTKFVVKANDNLLLGNFCYPCVNNPDRTYHRWKRTA